MKSRLQICLALFALSVGSVYAQSGAAISQPPNTPTSAVRQTVMRFGPAVQIQQITPAPLPGFYQVIASGHLLYVSADGKYVINGDLIDADKGVSLRDSAWDTYTRTELAKVPLADRIVYAPKNPKYTVTVFTDITCPYCRALHEEIAALNKLGIAVQYLAWPRAGVTDEHGQPTDSYNEMVAVWCAADRNSAFTSAQADHAPKPGSCKNPVKDQFELGIRLGVADLGTPTIFAEDGAVIGGFLTPEQLLSAVKAHAGTGT